MITGKHLILSGVLLAAAAICAETLKQDPSAQPEETLPSPGAAMDSKVPPMILVHSGGALYGEDGLAQDADENGELMKGFCVFEEGRWRIVKDVELPPLVPVATQFFSMWNPAVVFTMSRLAGINFECNGTSTSKHLLFSPKNDSSTFPVMMSRHAWHSPLKPVAEPPKSDELLRRMTLELQPMEEMSWLKEVRSMMDKEPYDPGKLHPAKLFEAYEFEIAPGEPAFFLTYRKQYGDQDWDCCSDDFSSYWCTIVRKNNLESLWSRAWLAIPETKLGNCYSVCGVADVNGDGVTEVVICQNVYEGWSFQLYEYREKRLTLVLDLTCS
ncbi:MAG: hypothetical protein GX580_13785 [Candidatus Hydrogenedens sp.]|nr:hypothetical protein [Candidatus Hydrogenedentota bacterium]NLF58701.1 hypothetical protein [Candidatus Hydrogenedens sp.]